MTAAVAYLYYYTVDLSKSHMPATHNLCTTGFGASIDLEPAFREMSSPVLCSLS